jgi:hypothetical protein
VVQGILHGFSLQDTELQDSESGNGFAPR